MQIPSLRVSVTGRCNLRCVYCHGEGAQEVRSSRRLSPQEIERIVRVGMGFGVRKVKLTGGEPLLRRDIAELVRRLSALPLAGVSLTTNGVLLAELAEELSEAGLARVNVSLDTLDERLYRRLTGGELRRVLAGVEAAKNAGLRVELNTVLMRGLNEGEVWGILEFASQHGCSVQLIELVRGSSGEFYRRHHMSLEGVEAELRRKGEVLRRRRSPHDRPVYLVRGVRVSLCSSVRSTAGCSGVRCSGLRLTADGCLRSFSYSDSGRVEVPGDEEGIRRAFELALARLRRR
ncbi:MAG: GTP 3',8-cyclase MoaA [Euryarchaeota archaeon]|nr:GTP 3',8-cyclase MoaA [Euryarchaeota archaeon]